MKLRTTISLIFFLVIATVVFYRLLSKRLALGQIVTTRIGRNTITMGLLPA
jgi:hypothetical protein